ncbi:hypothetical protein HFO84_00060 [Rhizobium leguminosarum]|uniref:hypothetical protein n=1 Tax=Rhizobium leguminosarum TaxID=384 RepID=UPI001C94628D|nr:hypothetical protein [Rhizobium leguminosarum]MBY5475724.1 hypothetical protein [Rhizobium leguminosarum]
MRKAIAASLLVAALSGCAATGIPDSLLSCRKWERPSPGTIRKDSDVIDYIEEGHAINDQCFANRQALIQYKQGRSRIVPK